jgi:citrate synthase
MTRTARLTMGDKTIELPLIEGTEGELAIDVSSLRAKTGLITFDPGFGTTAFCPSAITYSDGERGILRYRGIPIEQLAERSTFVETAFLLIHGRLPARPELDRFGERLAKSALLHESFKHHFDGFPVDAPPMAMLSAMINTLACFYPHLHSSREEDFEEESVWLLSKGPTIAASSYRRSLGLPFIYPDPGLSYASNFLHMMFSQPLEEYVASEEIARALNLVLILHADHELGCSTTTVRIVGSSRANLFASCAAGVCSLWGPVHGGATIAVVEMLEAIHRGDLTIDQALARAKDKSSGIRLKGFGHRIYKTFDPRAVILKNAAQKLLAHLGKSDPLLGVALELEDRALKDPYFIDHGLFPNADFYNGIMMRAIGIPKTMFTVMFAIGRMPGWIAHWKEQVDDPRGRIIRPRQVYVGPRETSYVPIEERAK